MKNIPNESPILPSAEHSPELPPAPPNSYDSPGYAPNSPGYAPNSPGYVIDNFPGNTPGNAPGYTPGLDEEGQPLKIQIPQNVILTPSSDSSQPPTSVPVDKETILEVDEPKPEEKNEGENSEGNSGSSNDSKKIILSADVNENA
jgi:beta-glucanase (GH16 family)